MRIASSTLAMSSQHTQRESYAQSEQWEYWTGSAPAAVNNAGTMQDVLDLSADAQSLLSGVKPTEDEGTVWQLSEKDKRTIALIEKFIEVLTGRKIKLVIPEKLNIGAENQGNLPGMVQAGTKAGPGWGLRYESHKMYQEAETMSFAATGSITTKEGQKIELNLTLAMNRTYVSEEHRRILAGNAQIDPLVINYGAVSAGLTAGKFAFDLDADGNKEQISFTAAGSGFLALDKNGDGMINDGAELFGPRSGDGFAELAAYDGDGNGWIDEDDPIFDQLRIWTKDEDGKDVLLALGERGVGAIYLGNVATGFSLKTPGDNKLQGQIRRTGLFLRENGTAGTVQHVDLAV